MDYKKLFSEIDALAPQMTADRRDLHKYAESAWIEFRTTSRIAARLEREGIPYQLGTVIVNPQYAMGYPQAGVIAQNIQRALAQGAEPRHIEAMDGYTGVVATIDTGRPGPVVALRFDIDSNDANEAVDDMTHRPTREGFASVNPGCQHACGHDGHTAIGLACAQVLNAHKDRLCGKIKIFFQPAEEGVRGAKAMVAAGGFDDVDYFLCGHIGAGKVGAVQGGAQNMLATNKFDVAYTGRSAHAGASPQEGKNALLAAASATLALHSLCQDSRGAARVNVGVLKAGVGRNVVPDQALLKVETRGATTEISDDVFKKAMRVVEAAAAMYDCTYSVTMMGGASGACSDEALVTRICELAQRLALTDSISRERPMKGSDDASYMMQAVQAHGGQATYMGWCAATVAPGHNSKFDFDEAELPEAAKIVCATVCDILKAK